MADPKLVVVQGANEGREFDLAGLLIVGRDQSVAITLQDPEVSRQHLQVEVEGDEVTIEDLGSTNGTFVNDERIAGGGHVLSAGDRVRMGTTVVELRVEEGGDEAAAPVAGDATGTAPEPGGPAAPERPEGEPGFADRGSASPAEPDAGGGEPPPEPAATVAEPGPEQEQEPETEVESEPQPEPEPDAAAEPDSPQPKPEPEPEPEPKPKAAAAPAPAAPAPEPKATAAPAAPAGPAAAVAVPAFGPAPDPALFGPPVPADHLAGWGPRAGAALVDGIICLLLAATVIGPVLYMSLTMARKGESNGQTLGKQLFDIVVIRDDRTPFGFKAALAREFAAKWLLFGLVMFVFTLGIGWLLDNLWPLWDDERQALHDKVVSTHVIAA